MIRNLKALGLALVAVFAMSALAASAAQATAGTLTTFPAGLTVIATSEQVGEHQFVLTDHEILPGAFATIKCESVTFTSTAGIATGATAWTVAPSYPRCLAFGLGQPATITTTGCDYVLKTGTPTTDGLGWHVATDIACTGGAVIQIVVATCEVQIGAQSGLITSQVTNSGAASPETARDLLLHTKITGLKYTVTKDAIGCPLKGTGSFSKGDYNGTTTVKARDSVTTAAVGITLH
jgi:hypothetical protein